MAKMPQRLPVALRALQSSPRGRIRRTPDNLPQPPSTLIIPLHNSRRRIRIGPARCSPADAARRSEAAADLLRTFEQYDRTGGTSPMDHPNEAYDMSPTRLRAYILRALAVILAILVAAPSGCSRPRYMEEAPRRDTPLAWSNATQWWLANRWDDLSLVWWHRCRRPPSPSSSSGSPVLAAELSRQATLKGTTIRCQARRARHHPITATASGDRSRSPKLFPDLTSSMAASPSARRSRRSRSERAGIPFDPAKQEHLGMGGKAPLLVDPCTPTAAGTADLAGRGATARPPSQPALHLDLQQRPSSIPRPARPDAGCRLRRQRGRWSILASPTRCSGNPPVTSFNVLRLDRTSHRGRSCTYPQRRAWSP